MISSEWIGEHLLHLVQCISAIPSPNMHTSPWGAVIWITGIHLHVCDSVDIYKTLGNILNDLEREINKRWMINVLKLFTGAIV